MEALNSQKGPVNIAADGNEDWAKTTLDLQARNVDDLKRELHWLGWTVEKFKELPAYKLALASGNYPWLSDL